MIEHVSLSSEHEPGRVPKMVRTSQELQLPPPTRTGTTPHHSTLTRWAENLDHNEALTILIGFVAWHLLVRYMVGLYNLVQYDPTALQFPAPPWMLILGCLIWFHKYAIKSPV